MPEALVRYCGAKTKDGTPCEQTILAENGRCRMHGGNIKKGMSNPNYKHGGYSQSIPARLANRYQEAVEDTELLSIRYDIALLKTRIDDVLEASERGESGELWNALREAKREYRQAGGKDADEKRAEALERILWLIEEGYQEWQTWKDVRFMLQERKTLVEAEEKRVEKMAQMLTVEELMSTVGVLMNIIQEEVVDRKSRQRIEERIGKLLTRQ